MATRDETVARRVKAVFYDLPTIIDRLRDTAENWVPQHFPAGRRVGDDWRLANIRGGAPRKQGSCVIALKGAHAGDWIDFDGDQGGDPLSTLAHATGLTGRDLFALAANLTGWVPTATRPLVARHPKSRPAAKDQSREIDLILSGTAPITGTIAARYLASRGLAIPTNPELLFHPDLVHRESRTSHPAMVAVVRDVQGERRSIHRTWLREDGAGKADLAKPRMMLGPVTGGAVRLADIGGDGVVGLAEGIETALSVMTACPSLPVWAALSAPNLEKIVLPPKATRVVILADHDTSRAGLRAAEAAASRLAAEGRDVRIAIPPRERDDFNDLLLRDGADAVRAVVDAAKKPAGAPDRENEEPADTDAHVPVGFEAPDGVLPELRADEGNLARGVRDTWRVLLASNRPVWLFRSAGSPTWVVRDDDGLPMAQPLTEDRLRHILAQLADWRRLSRRDDLVPAHPPVAIVRSILATPNSSLPVLAGIVMSPVFGKNGELLTEPGYHPGARLLYQPPARFVLPDIPARPTDGDIVAARSLLLDELLGEFPFTSDAERAHAVALLLVGFLRPMIDGPTPLHLIEKPTPGTGATLMVEAFAIILTGSGASVMVEGRDDEEWRKRLTAKLRQAPSLILIDNLRRRLDSSSVAAALTALFWEDRILGVSEMTRLPIRCIWIATGNNPEFSNEMVRRLIRIRLDAHIEQPWRRNDFRHPDLIGWTRANRPQLVAACLTLCQAWIAAGMPRGVQFIGSYEAWSAVMGGVLEVAGVPGFLDNLDETLEAADGEGAIWRSFVERWWEKFNTTEVGSGDLYQIAIQCEPPLALGDGGDRSQRTKLGRHLVRLRDRVFRIGALEVRVRSVGVKHQAQRWQLVVEDEASKRRSPPFPEPTCSGEPCNAAIGRSPQRSHLEDKAKQAVGEPWERGEPFPTPRAHTDAHTRATDDADGSSPRSPCSPSPTGERKNVGERVGERPREHSLPAPMESSNG